MDKSVHHVGELATFDSFGGMIPCKVIKVHTENNGFVVNTIVTIRITAKTHPVYKCGEVLSKHSDSVIPRNCWKRSKRGPFYINYLSYVWVE